MLCRGRACECPDVPAVRRLAGRTAYVHLMYKRMFNVYLSMTWFNRAPKKLRLFIGSTSRNQGHLVSSEVGSLIYLGIFCTTRLIIICVSYEQFWHFFTIRYQHSLGVNTSIFVEFTTTILNNPPDWYSWYLFKQPVRFFAPPSIEVGYQSLIWNKTTVIV